MTALALRSVTAFYGGLAAVRDLELTLGVKEVVGLLGPNGAGKTTVLRAVSGMVKTTGGIEVFGTDTAGMRTEQIARLGVAHVPAGRGTFPELTVQENLDLALGLRPRQERHRRAADLDSVLEYFPVLGEYRRRRAGALSGGQQQMLAIARGLLTRPRILMVDEPTLGLAPQLAREILLQLRNLRDAWGISVLLVEQNAALALDVTDRVYVLAAGRVDRVSTASELTLADLAKSSYLGGTS
ncbi:ABC transporter ATP-binding protein [Sphaerimonospora mesophila]|uniref:ABC transporter ATP-binding protein n=1 Tax=Sphaerimonospora mesophila TaxID=37483 RepID=UPI0006E374A7